MTFCKKYGIIPSRVNITPSQPRGFVVALSQRGCAMHDYTVVLGVGAALLHGTAYVLYNIQTHFGKSEPNPASWAIWTLLSILNAWSFREVSADNLSTLQFFTGSVACMITFFYTWYRGKLKRLKHSEWRILALALSVIVVWRIFNSATGANMLVVLTFIISFIPTLKGVLADPFKESPRSWWLWTAAFAFTIGSILLRWRGEPLALVMPTVLLIAHGSIAVLSSQKRKDKFST